MAKAVVKINSFTTGEVSPKLDGRTDLDFYDEATKKLENFTVFPQGGISKRQGTLFKSEAGDSTDEVRAINFIYSQNQSYIIEMGHEYMRFYMWDGQIWTGPAVSGTNPVYINDPSVSGTFVYEIATPFQGDEVFDIKYGQLIDQLFLTHISHPTQVLTRYDHADWTIADADFYGGPFIDENSTEAYTAQSSAVSGTATLTTNFSYFNGSMVGAPFKIRGDEVQEADIVAENTWTDIIQLDNGETLTAQTTGDGDGTATLQKSHDLGVTWLDVVTWLTNDNVLVTENDDGTYYRLGVKTGDYTSGTFECRLVESNKTGWATIDSYTSTTEVSATVDKVFPHTDATFKWSEGALSDWNGHAAAICFSKQRTILAGSVFEPTTFWGTQINDYTNFDEGTGLDDEAFAFTISSNDVNPIKSLVDARVVLAFTDGGVWKLSNPNEGLTPANPGVNKQTSYGSNNLQPIQIGNTVLYIQSGSTKMRSMQYDWQTDSWSGDEVSLRAEHLLSESTVVDWTFAARPDNLIYIVLANGDMAVCTFDQTNKIVAFSKFTTDGNFKSVTTKPGNDRDEVWAVVERTIQGTATKMIEAFNTPYWTEQNEYVFMDSALTYTGVPKTTLSGLDHLEGEEVTVLVDGAVHTTLTVSGGAVELQEGYEGVGDTAVVHVGKGYNAYAQTMRLNPPSAIGSSLGKQQVVYDVAVVLQDTINWKLGKDSDNLTIQKSLTPQIMSAAPLPFSGVESEMFEYGYDDEQYIMIASETPTPMTVLTIAATMRSSDR